jgi:hypothetical protein
MEWFSHIFDDYNHYNSLVLLCIVFAQLTVSAERNLDTLTKAALVPGVGSPFDDQAVAATGKDNNHDHIFIS